MSDALVGILAVVTAVLVLVTAAIAARSAALTAQTRQDVKEVHILVNSKMTAALARIEQLTIALLGSDTEVPEEEPPPSQFDLPEGTPA